MFTLPKKKKKTTRNIKIQESMTWSQENMKLIETVPDKAYTLDLLDRDFKSTAQNTKENQENHVSPNREVSINRKYEFLS